MRFIKLIPTILAVLAISYGSYFFLRIINKRYFSADSSYQYTPFNDASSQSPMTISEKSPRYKKNKQSAVLDTIKHKVQKEAEKKFLMIS